jgi:hypothetical protein
VAATAIAYPRAAKVRAAMTSGKRRTDQLDFENVRLGFQVGGKGQSAGFVGTVHVARQSAREAG